VTIREFKLPDLGEGLEDAEVVRWLVSEGDEVRLNQPLVEVDTAKALVEIPSPVAGKVAKLHASEGAVVKVGAPLVTFEVAEEAAEAKRTAVLVGYGVEDQPKVVRRRRLRATEGSRSGPKDEGPLAKPSVAAKPFPADRVLAAPPVRKLAKEMGVDLSRVSGTGTEGRITKDDVLAAVSEGQARPTLAFEAERQPEAAGREERIPVRGVRRRVAERVARSAAEIPHVTTFLTVDATHLLAARDAAQSRAGDKKVSPLAVVARAFVEICKEHPKLNASWDEEAQEIVLKRHYHLGVATDTERGLVVPVIKNADSKDVVDLAAEIARLAAAAREGAAAPEDLSGSTVTISNVGTFGAEFGTPIINWPESSILALGAIVERPLMDSGQLVVRPTVTLSLSFDHRIADGAEAGRALYELKLLLEDPARVRAL
jgi:pyruvate dehydrogenase E2 component (dihydrolipoamide acetyltransferase)